MGQWKVDPTAWIKGFSKALLMARGWASRWVDQWDMRLLERSLVLVLQYLLRE